jgi:hypothetical protein
MAAAEVELRSMPSAADPAAANGCKLNVGIVNAELESPNRPPYME